MYLYRYILIKFRESSYPCQSHLAGTQGLERRPPRRMKKTLLTTSSITCLPTEIGKTTKQTTCLPTEVCRTTKQITCLPTEICRTTKQTTCLPTEVCRTTKQTTCLPTEVCRTTKQTTCHISGQSDIVLLSIYHCFREYQPVYTI